MLSKELESSLNNAFNEARDKRHEYITVEHLLLALLDNSSANSVLQACGTDLMVLGSDLVSIWIQTLPYLVMWLAVKSTTRRFQRVFATASRFSRAVIR